MKRLLEQYRRDHTHPINKATHAVGIPLLMISLPMIALKPPLGLGLFAGGMALQLIGHAVEGNRPSFMRDPRFILAGAAWWLKRGRE